MATTLTDDQHAQIVQLLSQIDGLATRLNDVKCLLDMHGCGFCGTDYKHENHIQTPTWTCAVLLATELKESLGVE